MKHLIMGTAGHVDHGKTALVKALTGIDCDTHPEEKERGITIHLGFAHLALKAGGKIGIVDVPGHRDFIHTMLAGAAGIDFALLVIAADSGVMPQTREHLRIMEILGIKQGLIALTKVDLVDEAVLELCCADARELTAGTFLQAAPIIPCSAKTGKGLEELREAIGQVAEKVETRSADGVFRMYIDRIFSVSGFGTVVTGTVGGGKLNMESEAYLLPGKPDPLRVRRMERHGVAVTEIRAGDRASINLAGVEKSEVRRGMVIADRLLSPTAIFDAEINLHEPQSRLGVWSQVMFHTGTYENQARVHLIDKDQLKDGETGVAQIHLPEPCVLLYGDKFVIRSSSSEATLGGGRVVDPHPLHHRKRTEKVIREIENVARGDLRALIAAEISKSRLPASVEDIAIKLNISREAALAAIEKNPDEEIVLLADSRGDFFLSKKCLREMEAGIVEACREYRKKNPLAQRGANLNEIRGALKMERAPAVDEVIVLLAEKLVAERKLRETNRSWLPAESSAQPSEAEQRRIGIIEAHLRSCGMHTPLMSDLRALASRNDIGENDLKQVLHYLTASGKICRIGDDYLHHSVVDFCRQRLVDRLNSRREGLSVSEFRDLVGGNRKICLLLLSKFDAEGLTERKGDLRRLLATRAPKR